MKNPSTKAREVTFSVILPDTAFVSNFSMILKDNQVSNVIKIIKTVLHQFSHKFIKLEDKSEISKRKILLVNTSICSNCFGHF